MVSDHLLPAPLDPETFLDKTINFPDGSAYERLRPMTDFRRDPGEARVLYVCRRCDNDKSDGEAEEELVMKVKVQVPPRPSSDDPQHPLPGPSSTTAAELRALALFKDNAGSIQGVPHLMTSVCVPQSPSGPFPGGYINFTIMTKMPGHDLMDLKYWSLDGSVREEIKTAFLSVLKQLRWQNISPTDRALRNILWCSGTSTCSIVDFEHYEVPKSRDPINMHEAQELMAWGLVSRPPPSHWAVEWGLMPDPQRRGGG